MERTSHVVVVGAGAAGSSAALALRAGADAAGSAVGSAVGSVEVTVLGAEDEVPYNRTTVNKGLLSGAVDDAGIALPGMDHPGITWRRGCSVEALDPRTRVLRLRDGTRVQADAVVLATGAAPRALPAPVEDAARDRVVQLRTVADTHRLRELVAGADRDAPGPRRVVIAGAGLIGTEAAAVLLEAGCEVTLVDPAPRPLARHVGSTVADWVTGAHQAAGIDLRLGTTVTGVRADDPGLRVSLGDGDDVHAAVVVACLGVDPATGWLSGSGLPLQDGSRGGVVVDAAQRVEGHPGIYAAGDLAAVPGPDGTPVRVEHWGAALEQGRTAAASVLTDLGITGPTGSRPPGRPVPSYSTYVHATKLTILGWPVTAVAERPVLGRPGDPRFAVALLDATDRVVGAVGVGGARAVNALRPLIEARAPAADLGLPGGAGRG